MKTSNIIILGALGFIILMITFGTQMARWKAEEYIQLITEPKTLEPFDNSFSYLLSANQEAYFLTSNEETRLKFLQYNEHRGEAADFQPYVYDDTLTYQNLAMNESNASGTAFIATPPLKGLKAVDKSKLYYRDFGQSRLNLRLEDAAKVELINNEISNLTVTSTRGEMGGKYMELLLQDSKIDTLSVDASTHLNITIEQSHIDFISLRTGGRFKLNIRAGGSDNSNRENFIGKIVGQVSDGATLEVTESTNIKALEVDPKVKIIIKDQKGQFIGEADLFNVKDDSSSDSLINNGSTNSSRTMVTSISKNGKTYQRTISIINGDTVSVKEVLISDEE